MPTLAPLAGPDGVVTALGTRLIVRARPSAMAEIKQAIRSLDEPGRMLVVAVRQTRDRSSADESASVSGEVRAGDVRVTQTRSPGTSGRAGERTTGSNAVTGTLDESETIASGDLTQVLQVMEGSRAFIEVGRAVPVAQRSAVVAGGVVTVAEGTAYAEAESGFFVVPRLTNDGFTLDISARQESVDSHGRIEGQRLASTIAGSLGRWIHLGSALRGQLQSGEGLLSAHIREVIDQRSIELKVDLVQ